MPRVRLIEHYAGGVPGDEMEIDGGRASVLALRRVVEILPEPGVPPVAMEQDSGGYALPEPKAPEPAVLVVSDETLHRLAEERGFALAPEDAVVRIAEILGADEETDLLAAAESWAEGRDELERDLNAAKADVRALTERLETQRIGAETFANAAREQREGDAQKIAALEGELVTLKSAPLPGYGEADAKAYAEANGLTLIPAAELEALRAAQAPQVPAEPPKAGRK